MSCGTRHCHRARRMGPPHAAANRPASGGLSTPWTMRNPCISPSIRGYERGHAPRRPHLCYHAKPCQLTLPGHSGALAGTYNRGTPMRGRVAPERGRRMAEGGSQRAPQGATSAAAGPRARNPVRPSGTKRLGGKVAKKARDTTSSTNCRASATRANQGARQRGDARPSHATPARRHTTEATTDRRAARCLFCRRRQRQTCPQGHACMQMYAVYALMLGFHFETIAA